MASTVIYGQRSFAAAVASAAASAGHRVLAVSAPGPLDQLALWAARHGIPDLGPAPPAAAVPRSDVLVSAHSHAFIGARTRATATYAVGYHPSLLPRHRGRDAVRWTVHMGDAITGGTVYHLTGSVDGGPVAAQEHLHVLPDDDHHTLWARLFPLGVRLITAVLADADAGAVAWAPQDERAATWEPSWERPRMPRPELLELPPGPGYNGRYLAGQPRG